MIDKAMRRLSVVLIVRLFFAVLLAAPVHPAFSEMIQLQRQGGTYMVPVRINDAITLPFVIDSGAADVAIPADVVSTLTRTGTIRLNDFIGTRTYVLADGSELPSPVFIIHELRVGDHALRNITAHVASGKGDPLLGQSFLSKLPAWAIDNQRSVLVINDAPTSVGAQQPAALPSSQATPSAAAPVSAPVSAEGLVESGLKAFADKNYSDAMRLFRMAAAQGNAAAQNSVGVLYANGLGVSVNYTEAIRWYRMAADQGYPLAEYNIGELYEFGLGVSPDYIEAMRWYRMAADQGNAGVQNNIRAYDAHRSSQNYTALAQHKIGAMYLRGMGVPRDNAEAMRWFQKAAVQGNAAAQNDIGVLYENGWSVARDYSEAMRWFRMAAAQEFALAQNNIGVIIANGSDVTKDCPIAKQWLERAAAAGDEQARTNLRNGVSGACSW
jgi:uncharacterized protein